MPTVEEFLNQKGDELASQLNEDGSPLYNEEQIKQMLRRELGGRGISIDKGVLPTKALLNMQVTPTVKEHLKQMESEGKTEEEALLDMANRGFYDVRKNIKQYADRPLPDVLDDPNHKRRMETWADDYAVGSASTFGYDPYSNPTIQKAINRKKALERERTEGVSADYLTYLDWLDKKDRLTRGAMAVPTRGMGNLQAIRRVNEIEKQEPEVPQDQKEKAKKIRLTRGAMSRAQTEGAATGLGMALWKTLDETLGTGLLKDEEQTRYTRIPILDKNGRLVRDKKGKPKYRLEESPEEMLKFNLEEHTRLGRQHLNAIAKLRNAGKLTSFGKGKEELWDLIQGGMMLGQVFIPLLDNLTAGAIAAEENKANDPRFDMDDVLFQQKLQGFQNVQGMAGGLHAYFKPLMDSALLTTGIIGPEVLTPDQLKTAKGEQYVDVPLVGKISTPTLTNELKEQFKAFPLDGLLSVLSVSKLLSGLGSKSAMAFHNKAVKALKESGVDAATLAKFEMEGLEKLYTNQQKGYLRRIVESSVGTQADNAIANALPTVFRRAAGPVATVAKNVALGLVVGDAFGGVPGEGAIVATGAGALSGVSQLIKNVPALKRSLTPEIHASQNPYSDKWSRVAADRMARDQNLVDAAETGGEYQLRSGDRIDLQNLPAHSIDNVARITARVDLDPEVIAAKEALDSIDPESPNYTSALDQFDELKTRKFNEIAESELPFELRESGAHARVTELNRRRNRINETADDIERSIIDDARVAISEASRSAARSTDLDADLARIDAELRELDNADAARDLRLSEELNALERTNESKQRASYVSRTAEDQLPSVREQRQKAATLEFEEGTARLERQAAEAAAESSKRRLELLAQKAATEEQVILRQTEAENAALFAEGLIDVDEFMLRREQRPEVSAVEIHATDLANELKKHRARRERLLQRNLDDMRTVWEAMRDEYKTTLRFREGRLNPDKLVRGMRNYVFFDENGNLQYVPREEIEGAIARPGGGGGGITLEAPGPQASAVARKLSSLPIEEQLPILAALEETALRLALAGGGITSKRFRGGGKNALYRFYYQALASHIFDEYSPKLLRSPTMRKKFARYVVSQIGEELGIKGNKKALLAIEEMINDMASPRHYGGDFFVEPAYSIFLDGVEYADLADLFNDFIIRNTDPKELRRVALEALQSEIPILQARVGVNQAADVALQASRTNLDSLAKGPITRGRVNKDYIISVVEVFRDEGSLPIVINMGYPMKVDDLDVFPMGGDRPSLHVLIANDPIAKHEALRVLGELDAYRRGLPTPKYKQLLETLENKLSTLEKKEWVSINNKEYGLNLPETELYGAGIAPDPSPGVKTLHPVVEARNIPSKASRLTEIGDSAGGNIVVHKDFASTIGWLLNTTERIGGDGSLSKVLNWIVDATKAYTSFWKLTKTGLNPVNLTTNGISNLITLMVSEGVDPLTAVRIAQKGAVDMFTFIYNPMMLSPEKRGRMNAIIKTGGISNTILVKEVENVFRALAKDGITGAKAVDYIHALITGRSMDGVPLGSTRGGRLEKVGNISTAAQRRYSDVMRKAYRAFGDELFKYTKANLEMDVNAAKFRNMKPGASEVFFDIARGAYDTPPTMGVVVKLDNGDMVIRRSDGSTVSGPPDSPKVVKALDEFNAEVSMSSANSYYYNLGDLGRVLSGLRHVEGVFPMFPTFLSWAAKSVDIPLIKKGLFYRTMIDDVYSLSSDPAINASIINKATARSIRRNLFLLGLRKREMDNDDLRRMLPDWLAKGAIYGDLSSIVSNNQIPWSGFLDILGLADDYTRKISGLVDPKFAAEMKLFDKLGDPRSGSKATGMPIVDFTQAALFQIDPYTQEPYKDKVDWIRGVLMQVGGGLINAPRKTFELFAETEGVVSYKELKGMSRDMIQERMLMSDQQRSVAMVNALIWNRYRHINPEKTLSRIMDFPNKFKAATRKQIKDEWKIDIFDKSFDPSNPLAYFKTDKGRQAALERGNIDNLKKKVEQLNAFLGEDGAWYQVSDRMYKNLMSRMDKVNAKRFKKKYNELKSKTPGWSNFKEDRKWQEHFRNQENYRNPEY